MTAHLIEQHRYSLLEYTDLIDKSSEARWRLRGRFDKSDLFVEFLCVAFEFDTRRVQYLIFEFAQCGDDRIDLALVLLFEHLEFEVHRQLEFEMRLMKMLLGLLLLLLLRLLLLVVVVTALSVAAAELLSVIVLAV